MMTKLFKQYLPYLIFLLSAVFFLQLSDESRTPVTINASDMNRIAGYEDGTSIGLTPDSQHTGTMLKSSSYLLDAGTYTLGVAYTTNKEEHELILYDNGKKAGSCKLDPDTTYQEYTFELEHSSLDFCFEISYGGESNLLVQSITLIPADRFYTDTSFLITLLIVFTILFAIWRFLSRIRASRSEASSLSVQQSSYTALMLLGIGLFASLPYLNTGLSWAIDLCYHLIRIEGIKDGLLSGQFPVVIYPEALHGNGYLNCMYPNLFLYLPAYLRMKGVSMADSFKFLIFVFNFATAFLTYHCTKTIGGTQKAALLASFLYTCCPYRFANIYARGAVGEFLAMTFFPLVFAGLYHILIGDRRKWGYLVLGMSGLLQSHVLSVTLGGIFCGIFSLLYLRELFAEKRILELAKAAIVSLLLNLGFLIPFLDFYENGNLWMDALELGSYQEYTLNLSGLFGFQSTGDYYTLTLGIPLAVCAVIALSYVLSEHRQTKPDAYVQYLFLLGCVLTFMMLNFFPGWDMMSIPVLQLVLGKIQFAWRLLGPISLLFAVCGSICLFRSRVLSDYSRILFIVLIGLCMLTAPRFQSEDFAYSSGQSYTTGHLSKLTGIPKGKNTVVYPFEWRPKHVVDSDITAECVLSEKQQIHLEDFERTGTVSTLQYRAFSKEQYIEIPVIFYKGYQAKGEDGTEIPIEKGQNSRIRIPLSGDGSAHTVTISYHAPVSYTVSAWLSILTAVLLLIYFCISHICRNGSDFRILRKERKHDV